MPTMLAALAMVAMHAGAARAEPPSRAPALAAVIAPIVSPERDSGIAGSSSAAAYPGVLGPVSLPIADEVIVRKSQRRLYLMRDGKVLRSYRIALGLVPQGPKRRSGDFRTPEGHYLLTRRNPRSDYFLSIQVSYPDRQDVARAAREHVDPGGAIMIHGLPNTLSHKPRYYATSDWTDGCIALSDSDMVEVWLMTRDNTPIDILP